MHARILDLAEWLPAQVLANDELAALYPEWSADKILAKTGIRARRLAAPGETAADLAAAAAERLFAQGVVARAEIDFILLCTQAPDYLLPTTACVLQERLGIARSAGALDFNLGCSGFVVGLSLAKGLVESGAARRVLLLTADTYSKYIHAQDRSVRTLFGDGAAATVVGAADAAAPDGQAIGPFVFGTDGRGAHDLIVATGGARHARDAASGVAQLDANGNLRSRDDLYMNGAEVFAFSLREVPKAIDALLDKAGLAKDDIDYFVLHQANRFMLDALRKKIGVAPEKLPIHMEDVGNTVSSTIPLTLIRMRAAGQLRPGARLMLVGFGVGYSWAATILQL
ncbi:ketoacyl-ACP synthase III [Massilia forsythiae]|uniref:Ketoacyl-ACP synthase III n=1 Tax=Massilia forsythiae TaxID=2728020 RepID=A0A7Z2ZRC2_9BURK|nr:ketoacyl-ACP synthase III [Massilia forsythiae]QJD99018.1 ketoacyl-ACP synthase III [Massilia forsythiae]